MTNNQFPRIAYRMLSIALPISAGRLFNILANFIAMMMVSVSGKEQLAAGALAISTQLTILTLFVTIFYALGIRIRYHQGQKGSPTEVGVLVKNGFILAMILAMPAALIIKNMDKILLAFNQDPQLVFLTVDYFRYAAMAVFPLLAMMVIGQFYLGIGNPSILFIAEVINFPLIILVSYGFVLGHFGLPPLGLSGVSLANLLAQLVTVSLLLILTYVKGHFRYYQLLKDIFLPNWVVCRSILTLGLPIGIQFGGELAAIAVVGYLMGFFGVNALAALQITNQYSIIGIMLSFSLAQALSLMISELYGRHEIEYFLVKKYLGAAVILLAIYIVPVAILFCVCSTAFAQLYLGTNHIDPEIKYLINHFFILSAFFLFLDGFRNLLSGALRGLHQSGVSSRINLGALWLISLPASWVTVFVFKGGPVSLRASFLSGFVVAVILLAMQFYKMLSLIAPPSIDEMPETFFIEG